MAEWFLCLVKLRDGVGSSPAGTKVSSLIYTPLLSSVRC